MSLEYNQGLCISIFIPLLRFWSQIGIFSCVEQLYKIFLCVCPTVRLFVTLLDVVCHWVFIQISWHFQKTFTLWEEIEVLQFGSVVDKKRFPHFFGQYCINFSHFTKFSENIHHVLMTKNFTFWSHSPNFGPPGDRKMAAIGSSHQYYVILKTQSTSYESDSIFGHIDQISTLWSSW